MLRFARIAVAPGSVRLAAPTARRDGSHGAAALTVRRFGYTDNAWSLFTSPAGLAALLVNPGNRTKAAAAASNNAAELSAGDDPSTVKTSKAGSLGNANNHNNRNDDDQGDPGRGGGGFFAGLRDHRQALVLGAVIMVATWAAEQAGKRWAQGQTLLREQVYTTLEVRSHQPEFDMLLCWLSEQPIGARTRNVAIRSGRTKHTDSFFSSGDDDDDNEGDAQARAMESSALLARARDRQRELRAAARRALCRLNGLDPEADAAAADDDAAAVESTSPREGDASLPTASTELVAELKRRAVGGTAGRMDDAAALDGSANAAAEETFVPGYGTHRVAFEGHTLWLTREIDSDMKQGPPSEDRAPDELMTIVALTRDRAVVERLVEEARLCALRQRLDKTTVHVNKYGHWDVLCRKPKRYLESVFVPPAVRAVADEVSEFIESRAVYRAMGVPWRRGYMLSGPPGTGKSSFILALAGEYSLPVYVLSLDDDVTDGKFLEYVNRVPAGRQGALLVIEDLDTAIDGIKGSGDDTVDSKRRGKLSLSGVLNALDGIASSEGRVLVVTSNTPESRLPPALVRTGRIDRVVEFERMREPEVRRMLRAFGCGAEAANRHAELLDGKVSPAQVQAALQLANLKCSDAALAPLAATAAGIAVPDASGI
jgi:hypothetical protein